jgi:signal transduction histidine kinase
MDEKNHHPSQSSPLAPENRQDQISIPQQVLANLIHEIGRPLGSLRTALHALQTGAMNDPDLRNELLRGMAERVTRIGRLLDDLALTTRGLEPQEIEFKSIPINPWLDSLVPLWAESAYQKKITWQVQIPGNLPILETDPDRLAQALGNLVNNAIKFTPVGGQVTLSVHQLEDKIQFSVSDSGIGISPEDQQNLFVPFFRSDQVSWKAPGLGLGLSITKTITESLGGEISLTSALDQGSTFTITLPVQKA